MNRRAFTLVEMIVATVLTAVISLVALGISRFYTEARQ